MSFLLLAVAAAYAVHVQQRRAYLVECNFRRLAAMSERIDARLLAFREAVTNLVQDPDRKLASLHSLYDFEMVDGGMVRTIPEAPFHGETLVETRAEGGSSWFHFTYHGDGALHVRARLPGVLAPALESEGFDKLLFAEAGGQVLFQSGRHDIDVRTLPGILDKKPEEVQKLRLGESSRLLDVEIAGEPYKLFLQPCGNLRQGKGPSGWILGGLVRADRLRAAALQVSPIWVIVFASFVLLSALAWPFLRLIAMTPGERLRSIDGLLLALCALTGLATLTILLFDGLVYLGLSHIAERQVEALAVGVRDRLEHEVDAALLRLAAVHGQALATAAAAAPTLASAPASAPVTVAATGACAPPDALDFFWADENGSQVLLWLPPQRSPSRGNVQERRFFADLAAGRLWTRSVGGRVFRFALEPIRTSKAEEVVMAVATPWEGGEEGKAAPRPMGIVPVAYPLAAPTQPPPCPMLAARIEPGKRPFLTALITRMRGLERPLLPPGLGFAVIDAEGKVLFHSNSQKNLQESFFEEADGRLLLSLLFAQRSEQVKIQYGGRDYQAYPMPVRGTRWSVVAFRDLALVRTTHVQILIIAVICLIFYVGTLILLFSVLYLLPAFRARWIWPWRKLKGTYIQLIAYYLLCLAVFAVSLRAHGGPALLFWTGMLMPLFVLFVTYLKIHFDRFEGDLRKFQTEHWVALSLAALALLALSILTLPQLPVDVRFFIVGSVLVGLGLLFLPSITELLSSPSALRPQQAYLLAATLLLAVLAIPPAASFFKLSCDIPVENLVKLGQVGFLRAFETDPELLGGTGSPARMVYTSAFFSTFPYRSRCDGKECLHGREREPRLHDSWLLQQLERVLPDYNGSATAMAKLTADVVPERAWQWEHVKNGRLVLHGPVTGGAEALHLESALPSLAFSLVRWVWVAVGLGGLGVVVIGLMWFLVRNLLLLNVEVPSWLQRVRDGGKLSISALGGNLFFISRRADLLQRIEAQMETGIIHIDLEKEPIRSGKLLSAPSVAGKEFVLINHFEHRLDDVDYNRAKLHLLESLSRDSGRRLVVLSSVDPYLCFVNGSLFSGSGDAAGERARWMSLLADFETFDLDQQVATGRLEAALDSFRRSSERKSIPWPKAAWSRHTRACLATLQEDCCVTAPLQLIGEQLLPDLDLERMGRAEIVDEVRERAELYYRALWSSLTDLEKTTLFQLAEEGLVNPKNRRPLQRLLARGLVVRKPAPRLMNESFRRFVMSGTCRREARELERRCEARGNWSRLQPFFSAVLLGVVGFLYVTQREAFDSTLLFLTALAGAMPHVLKLVGVFGAAQAHTDAEA